MKKNPKKIFLFMIVVIMTMVCFTFSVGAMTFGDFEYSILSDGTVEVTDYIGSATDIYIPSEIDGKSVTSLGGGVFRNCTTITKITIPDSVKKIGSSAFYNCIGLTELVIPASAEIYNSSNTFGGCTNIKNITITKGTKYMCNYVDSADVNGFTYYKYTPWHISENCKIVIENGVEEIGSYAFYDCDSIKELEIPASTKMRDTSFFKCSNIDKITITKGNGMMNTYVMETDSIHFLSWRYTPWCISKSSTVIIENGVENISNYAFYGCYQMKNIEIPDSVTEIGEFSFYGCKALNTVKIPEKVTKICSHAFVGCSSLTNVTLPDSVISIGDGAFENCISITDVKISKNVEYIDEYVFYKCSSLNSIIIPKSALFIGECAFAYCEKLEDVTILASVRSIDKNAFYKCTRLKIIYYCNDKTRWDNVSKNAGITTNPDVHYNGCTGINKTTVNLEPTCIYDGLKTVTCACGTNSYTETIEMLGHSYSDLYTIDRESSCYYEGSKSRYCIRNGCTARIDTTAIKKKPHTSSVSVPENVVISTCSKKGSYEEVSYCSICKIEISRVKKEIGVLAHINETVTQKATLTNNGKIETKCSVCGYVSKNRIVYYPKTIKLSKTEYTYNGKVQTASVTVKDFKGNTLKKDTDYTVKYESGRKLPGKYTVTVIFKGKYSGEKKLTYTIAPRSTSKLTASQTTTIITLKWNKVTGADGYRVYKYNSKTKKYEKLKDVTGTSLKISKLKAGTAYKYKVRSFVKDGDTIFGAYSSELSTATKCVTPKITKLTTSKAKASLAWSDVSGESGYQVYYSSKKNSGYKKAASYKAGVTKGSMKKLKSGKTYYFKVRAYKTVGDTKVCSAWSLVKSVKIK